MAGTSLSTPVTFDAAENEPMTSGRPATRASLASRSARSTAPAGVAPTSRTSAMDSVQGSSLEWCS